MINKKQINLKNIIAYLQGNIRYYLWYSKLPLINKNLIRKHIKEQIEFRIRFMDNDCYINGQCSICECETTALQMANKSCDKPCYPEMMNKEQWINFTTRNIQHSDSKAFWQYLPLSMNNKNERMTAIIFGGGIKELSGNDKSKIKL